MQLMVAAKQVMADWQGVVKCAGSGKENHNKAKGKNNSAMVPFHQRINSIHVDSGR
jgi:hypothetical protein